MTGMNETSIELSVDQDKIRGKLYTPNLPSHKIAVLFLHGLTGKPNYLAAVLLAEAGYHVLAISMRGHGDSDGDIETITANQSLADAKVAYDFLQDQVGPSTQIVVVGNSYGSYIAALLSVEKTVVALSLRVPANYQDSEIDLPKWGRGHEDPNIMVWRNQSIPYDQNRALTAIHDFTGPVQVIEAENDAFVPHQTVQNYVDAIIDQTHLSYTLMAGWPHSLGTDQTRAQQFQAVLEKWLIEVEEKVQ
jgi:esterase/lipase